MILCLFTPVPIGKNAVRRVELIKSRLFPELCDAVLHVKLLT